MSDTQPNFLECPDTQETHSGCATATGCLDFGHFLTFTRRTSVSSGLNGNAVTTGFHRNNFFIIEPVLTWSINDFDVLLPVGILVGLFPVFFVYHMVYRASLISYGFLFRLFIFAMFSRRMCQHRQSQVVNRYLTALPTHTHIHSLCRDCRAIVRVVVIIYTKIQKKL